MNKLEHVRGGGGGRGELGRCTVKPKFNKFKHMSRVGPCTVRSYIWGGGARQDRDGESICFVVQLIMGSKFFNFHAVFDKKIG